MSFEKNQSWIVSCILYGTEAIHFSGSLQPKNAVCYGKQKVVVHLKSRLCIWKNLGGDGDWEQEGDWGGGGGVMMEKQIRRAGERESKECTVSTKPQF